MKLEDYVSELRAHLGEELLSVILYGSAASAEFVKHHSDFNILVVLRRLTMKELRLLSEASRTWVIKAGNPPPLSFTPEKLASSADVFPIELLEMQENHRVLFGSDAVAQIPVTLMNLRHQLEYELKSKLIVLRERYLATGGAAQEVGELMIQSLANFLVLFRAALRLYQQNVPATKLEALHALSARLGFSTAVFEEVQRLRSGENSARDVNAASIFERYLNEIETVVDKVDHHLHAAPN